MGLAITAVSKTMKMATAISFIIYFPMIFLSGATMPIEIFPENIVFISKALPLSYGVVLMKGIWLGGSLFDHPLEIAVLLGTTLVFSLIALKFFKWE